MNEAGRSDEQLSAELKKWTGGTPALHPVGELLDRHWEAAFAYARLCTDGARAAGMLTTAAFTRLFGESLRQSGPTAAWRPHVLVAVRRIAAEWDADGRQELLHPALRSGETGERAAARLLPPPGRRLLSRAFQRVPQASRAVLWHTEVEAEPLAVPAALLGLDEEDARVELRRARERLREECLQVHRELAPENECRRYQRMLDVTFRRGGVDIDPDLREHLGRCGHCSRTADQLATFNTGLGLALAEAVLGWGARAYVESRANRAEEEAGPAPRPETVAPPFGEPFLPTEPSHRTGSADSAPGGGATGGRRWGGSAGRRRRGRSAESAPPEDPAEFTAWDGSTETMPQGASPSTGPSRGGSTGGGRRDGSAGGRRRGRAVESARRAGSAADAQTSTSAASTSAAAAPAASTAPTPASASGPRPSDPADFAGSASGAGSHSASATAPFATAFTSDPSASDDPAGSASAFAFASADAASPAGPGGFASGSGSRSARRSAVAGPSGGRGDAVGSGRSAHRAARTRRARRRNLAVAVVTVSGLVVLPLVLWSVLGSGDGPGPGSKDASSPAPGKDTPSPGASWAAHAAGQGTLHGRLHNLASGLCVGVVGKKAVKGAETELVPCSATPSQEWTYETDGLLRDSAAPGLCLDSHLGYSVVLAPCSATGKAAMNIRYDFTLQGALIPRFDQDLALTPAATDGSGALVLKNRAPGAAQRWSLDAAEPDLQMQNVNWDSDNSPSPTTTPKPTSPEPAPAPTRSTASPTPAPTASKSAPATTPSATSDPCSAYPYYCGWGGGGYGGGYGGGRHRR
ncbi:ricin-type beta-trefoil lectin protein [Streptomyces puniciscabiei]|uniref:Ricin-type beta-trefoil lectin protein n=1 Tax=Streptomyces puniciscabiei TaxID=164348 RepID=A0A542SXV6_9ACTN|nr:RICIN domain-containing protein [Streptomyces puniciscabiei]TQK79433.1 ricin-type beta-trefoil lectin protein [Streptomyces puniciscabiei]